MNPILLNLLTGLGYSAFGFILGWAAGRVGKDLPKESVEQLPQKPWWPIMRLMLGIIILILVAYTVISGIVTAAHDRGVVECQTQLNQDFRTALVARSQAAANERTAQKTLLLVTSDPKTSQTAKYEAIQNYLKTLDAADQARADSPLIENTRCD